MRPTESELWETLDLPASQAGGGNTWMPRRIERGALDASCTRADVISLRRRLLSFFGVFLFWRPQSGARPALHGDGIRYGAHRSTGFAARFQPIDRGNRELGGHGKAQTLAGDWAVQARRPSWLARRPACCGAQHAELHANAAVYVRVGDGTVCSGRRRRTSNFQRLDTRDPGDSRQCSEDWCSFFVTRPCPPACPSGHRRRWC